MKKIFTRFALLAASLLMTACYTNIIHLDDENNDNNNNDNGNNDNYGEQLIIDEGTDLRPALFADNNEYRISFTSNGNWNLMPQNGDVALWCFTERMQGEAGSHSLEFFLADNLTGSERQAAYLLECNGESAQIILTQQPVVSNGELPQPAEPVTYSRIVEKIIRYELVDGEPQPDYRTEWQFRSEDPYNRVTGVEIVQIYSDGENEQVTPTNVVVVDYTDLRYTFYEMAFLTPEGHSERTFRLEGENNLDGYVSLERVSEKDSEGNPLYEEQRYYIYRDGYPTVNGMPGSMFQSFEWEDGNLTRIVESDLYNPFENLLWGYNYSGLENDASLNIDLNYLTTEDFPKILGFYGSRSRSLASVIQEREAVRTVDYRFDEQNRVSEISCQSDFGSFLFEIIYR